jgi:hypothetical protein
MNDIQLYNYYKSIPLASRGNHSWIYPTYVVITGRGFCYPHPHRYFTLEEFLDKIEEDKEFYERLNK